jgi:hypothetical protein
MKPDSTQSTVRRLRDCSTHQAGLHAALGAGSEWRSALLEECIVLIAYMLQLLNSMLLAFLVDEVLLPPEIVVGKSTLQVVTSFV